MKLGTKGHYAILALLDILKHSENKPVALVEIAGRQNLPVPYLEQIFAKLRRKGLVKSDRGYKGGYSLSLPPQKLTILEVIQAVEEPIQTRKCSSNTGISCQGKSERCSTHHLWEGLEKHIQNYLSQYNLFDLSPSSSHPVDKEKREEEHP